MLILRYVIIRACKSFRNKYVVLYVRFMRCVILRIFVIFTIMFNMYNSCTLFKINII